MSSGSKNAKKRTIEDTEPHHSDHEEEQDTPPTGIPRTDSVNATLTVRGPMDLVGEREVRLETEPPIIIRVTDNTALPSIKTKIDYTKFDVTGLTFPLRPVEDLMLMMGESTSDPLEQITKLHDLIDRIEEHQQKWDAIKPTFADEIDSEAYGRAVAHAFVLHQIEGYESALNFSTDVIHHHIDTVSLRVRPEGMEDLSSQTSSISYRVRVDGCKIKEKGFKNAKQELYAYFEQAGGAVEPDGIFINEQYETLSITFTTAEAKRRCMEINICPYGTVRNGDFSIATMINGRTMTGKISAVVSNLPLGTTTEQISDAVKEAAPTTIAAAYNMGAYAFLNVDTYEDMNTILNCRFLQINHRPCFLAPSMACDEPNRKAIVSGFDKTNVPTIRQLYEVLDVWGKWDIQILQSVTYDNGRLRPYYFARFNSVEAKKKALRTPFRFMHSVIFAKEIRRQDSRLVLPASARPANKANLVNTAN